MQLLFYPEAMKNLFFPWLENLSIQLKMLGSDLFIFLKLFLSISKKCKL